MKSLSDAEFGRLMRALLKYSMTGEPVALRGSERYFAERIMDTEDRHKRSYDEVCAARSRAGKASAEARRLAVEYAAYVDTAQQNKETEKEKETETEKKSLFSYEKKAPRGRAAPQKKDNSWMRQYD